MAKTKTAVAEKSAKDILADAKLHIESRAKDIEALRSELDEVAAEIAQGVIAGADTSSLNEKQIGVQVQISRLELVLTKLRESLPDLQRQVALEDLHAKIQGHHENRRQRRELDAQIAALHAQIKPLQAERDKLYQTENWLAGRVYDLRRTLETTHGVERDFIDNIVKEYEANHVAETNDDTK